MGSWEIARVTGTPGQLHERPLEPLRRRATRCDPTAAAVVLGSTQPADTIDPATADRLGLAVVRRRSGGGAVIVRPGRLLWVDVCLPSGDPVWHDDVGRSFEWLGDVWAGALTSLGAPRPAVHRGGARRSSLARVLCFAGTGAGEVSCAGRKVVGLAQRRVRSGARFHCAVLLEWDATEAASLVAGTNRREAERELQGWSAGLGDLVDDRSALADRLWAAFVERLPR